MASSPLVELEGVGGGGAGGAGDVSSLGGVGGICSGVANLTLFTFGSSSGFLASPGTPLLWTSAS